MQVQKRQNPVLLHKVFVFKWGNNLDLQEAAQGRGCPTWGSELHAACAHQLLGHSHMCAFSTLHHLDVLYILNLFLEDLSLKKSLLCYF